MIAASSERSGQQKRFGASLKPAATQNAERPLAEDRVVPQRACIAHMYIRAFLITALCLPSRCKPSARPLPSPRPCHVHARPRRPLIPPHTRPHRRKRPSRSPPSIRRARIVSAPPESNSRRSRFHRPPNRDALSSAPLLRCGALRVPGFYGKGRRRLGSVGSRRRN